MMILHFVFSVLSFSSGLPGGSFIPTLVTGGLIGQIVALILVRQGIIGYENISYVMLICMSAFLVAVIRTPLTAIVLITEITGHLEVFYPSIVVGGLTYYFTEMLQIQPFNVTLYDDMINSPEFQEEKRYTLSVEVMSGSYFEGKQSMKYSCRNVVKLSIYTGTGKIYPGKAETCSGGIRCRSRWMHKDIENYTSLW